MAVLAGPVWYPKSTRSIWKCRRVARGDHLLSFDAEGNYLSPLAKAPGKMRQSSGSFLTTETEQWPAACTYGCSGDAPCYSGKIRASSSTPSSSPYPTNPPEGPAVLGGWGRKMASGGSPLESASTRHVGDRHELLSCESRLEKKCFHM